MRHTVLGMILVALVAVGGCTHSQQSPPTEVAPGIGYPQMPAEVAGPFPVTRVVDGDTIWVSDEGERVKLRLIGIDTPETSDPRKPVQCFGEEATRHAHELLDDENVFLEVDPSQGRTDRYGRTLAYVWLTDGRMFNLEQIAGGFAHEYTYDLPYRYHQEFMVAERSAREGSVGLWNPATCGGRTS